MARKRKFSKPFDLAHSVMFNEFPKEYTKIIGVPGEFVEVSNRRVHLKDGSTGEMDSAYVANPDSKILFEKVAVCLEHQSGPVNNLKLNSMGNYDVQLVVNEHLPTFLVVASHLNEEKSKKQLVRSPSDITKLYFLDLGEENICERLNNVIEILKNNNSLSTEDALNLGVIALYAPRRNACRIVETVVNIYLEIIDDLDFKMEFVLYSVIILMIDAFFEDKNEYERLNDMVDEKTSPEVIEKLASFEDLLKSLDYANEDLAIVNENLATANEDLAAANKDLATANKDLATANEDLAAANEDLAIANHKIANLEAENRKLKEELDAK